jgi:hypothetical protein
MKFYHGTTADALTQILKEGVLWGRRGTFYGREVDRCTYLAVDKEEAMCYGDVLLEVEYEPIKGRDDNYYEGCWQVRVYKPIPISDIKVISKQQ